MPEIVDGVVAEQVGVGEHHHPSAAVTQGDRQRAARKVGGGRGLEQDGRARGRVQHARAVEARLTRAGRQVLPLGRYVGAEHPGRHAVVGVARVLDGGVLDAHAEPGQQLGQVVAVLLLLALGEHDQAAAVRDVLLDGVELLHRQDRAAEPGGALPAVGGGMGDDEDVVGGEHGGRDRALGVGGDGVPEVPEGLRGAGVAVVVGVRRVDRLGDRTADRP